MRSRIVTFLIEHIAFFRKHIQHAHIGYTLDNYVSSKLLTTGNTSSWATDIEIEATATMLQMPVYLLSKWGDSDSYVWQKFKPAFKTDTSFAFTHSAFVALIGTGDHFMLATSTQFPCNCLCQPPFLMHAPRQCAVRNYRD